MMGAELGSSKSVRASRASARVPSQTLSPQPARTTEGMTDVTSILDAIGQGDPDAAERLLPLVYDELRRLAARHLGREAAGQTLDATALVHEAYLRLVGGDAPAYAGRGHF